MAPEESNLKKEEEFTPYSFEGVEENANPLEFFNENSDAQFNQSYQQHSKRQYKKLNTLFSFKEFFDRLGYGFAAHQFITILFFLSGAGPFVVGLIFGIRSALTSVLASLSRAYAKVNKLSPHKVAYAGVIFGFSLVGLIFGVRFQSPLIFAISILIGSVGVVTYGELYDRLVQENIKHEKKNHFLKHITHYGLFITAIAFFLSGWLFDYVGMHGTPLLIGTLSIPLAGYFLSFELGAILFFLSGYFIRKLPLKHTQLSSVSTLSFLQSYIHQFKTQIKLFFTNKYLFFLYVGALLISTVEVLGASYYGFIIYDLFKSVFLGGFLNVALIFGVAIFASFLGPIFTKFLYRTTGLAPMFVFGSLLIAILPLTLLVNDHFVAIVAAVSFAVIGSSILGVAQGLLARKLLPPSHRKAFFQSIEVLLTVPFLILVPIGALLTQVFGFTALYYFIIVILIGVVLPLYFTLVLISNRKQL